MRLFLFQLVCCSVIMTVISLLYMLLSSLLGYRYSAKSKYYSWLILLLGFLTPWKPALYTPIFFVDSFSPYISGQNAGTAPITPNANIYFLLFMVWLIGVTFYLSITVFKYRLYKRYIRRFSTEITDQSMLVQINKTAMTLGIRKPIAVRECLLLNSPLVIGFYHPILLLPKMDFQRSEFSLIIKHELVHLKRKDILYKELIVLCNSIHWFNPFFYFIRRTIEKECEVSCDEIVLNKCDKKTKLIYCDSLLHVGINKQSWDMALSTQFNDGKNSVKKRIASIIAPQKKHKFVAVCILLLMAALFSGTWIGTGSNPWNHQSVSQTTVNQENHQDNATIPSNNLEIEDKSQETKTSTPQKSNNQYTVNSNKGIIMTAPSRAKPTKQ